MDERVRAPKMAEIVAQRLRRQIVSGELAAGEALPAETTLTERFGVSRPTLREAIRVLESEGLVVVRRGVHGGARVQPPSGEAAARYVGFVLEHRGTSLADIYQARAVIEAPCARLLALRPTADGLRRLKAELDDSRRLLDSPEDFIRRHTRFHALVVDLAGNTTLSVLSDMVRHIVDQTTAGHVEAAADSATNLKAARKGFRAHERLIGYVEAGRADDAEELWRRHLVEGEDYLLSRTKVRTTLDLLG